MGGTDALVGVGVVVVDAYAAAENTLVDGTDALVGVGVVVVDLATFDTACHDTNENFGGCLLSRHIGFHGSCFHCDRDSRLNIKEITSLPLEQSSETWCGDILDCCSGVETPTDIAE